MIRLVLMLGACLLPQTCLADSFYGEILNSVLEDYLGVLETFRSGVAEATTRLFWIMCAISLVTSAIGMVFRGDDFQSFMGFVVKYMLIIGVFLYLINNNFKICASVFDSVLSIVWTDYTASQMPMQILFSTIDIAQEISAKVSPGSLSVAAAIAMYISILIFVLAMLICVVRFIIIFVSGYVMCVAGAFAVGFAPFGPMRHIAVNYVHSIIATGLKLFTAAMILQCTNLFMTSLNDTIEVRGRIDDFRDIYAVLFVSLLTCGLMIYVPNEIAAIFSGGGQGGDSGLQGALRSGASTVRRLGSFGGGGRRRS